MDHKLCFLLAWVLQCASKHVMKCLIRGIERFWTTFLFRIFIIFIRLFFAFVDVARTRLYAQIIYYLLKICMTAIPKYWLRYAYKWHWCQINSFVHFLDNEFRLVRVDLNLDRQLCHFSLNTIPMFNRILFCWIEKKMSIPNRTVNDDFYPAFGKNRCKFRMFIWNFV